MFMFHGVDSLLNKVFRVILTKGLALFKGNTNVSTFLYPDFCASFSIKAAMEAKWFHAGPVEVRKIKSEHENLAWFYLDNIEPVAFSPQTTCRSRRSEVPLHLVRLLVW